MGELIWRQHNRPWLHRSLTLRSPSGTLGIGLATRVTMRVVVTIPLIVTLSLASELEPPSLSGTMIGTLLWSGTSVMGLTRLSAWWKRSDDLSDGWMTLHTCKWRCKPPSTHRSAWCTTSSVTLGLTLMLKSYKDSSLGEVLGAQVWVLACLVSFSAFPVILSLVSLAIPLPRYEYGLLKLVRLIETIKELPHDMIRLYILLCLRLVAITCAWPLFW
jgi:hypothetical protein